MALADLRAWGVEEGYHDVAGAWRVSPASTIDAVLAAMGAGAAPPGGGSVAFVRPGRARAVAGPAVLATEDGGEMAVDGRLPPDLPPGYHTLTSLDDGARTTVVVSPGRCPLPIGGPAWGWAVQLYALRSAGSWGMGDLADLRALARWSAGLGAGLVLVNPLHAASTGLPQEPSPYFPGSRRFRSPLYLRVEDVPGAVEGLGGRLGPLAAAARDLNSRPRIDRDAVWRLKLEALGRLWEAFEGDPELDRWCAAEGDGLAAFATFCVLAEHHGRDWRRWPAPYRHPDHPRVAAFAGEHRGRVRFHQWLQWLLDRQLQAASAELAVVADLAVGVDPGGADAWRWQDVVAEGMAVGAPPDEFNTRGQDWGVAAFDPWRMRAAGYRPFAEAVRAALGHAGGLRIDHVMGLFRLFWVPGGVPPDQGAYVRYPSADLLDVLALECHRAGAFAVGEDLGTVEDGVRQELADRNVLSCRVLWFEESPPPAWPAGALGSVGTHDLPTIAGLWTGSDLDDQRGLGLVPNEASTSALRARLAAMLGVADDAPVDEVVARTYGLLGSAPCRVLVASLEDALGVAGRTNMPGTIDSWPNWSVALPATLEELPTDPRAAAVAAALDRRSRP